MPYAGGRKARPYTNFSWIIWQISIATPFRSAAMIASGEAVVRGN
jgi:hypothetical protein